MDIIVWLRSLGLGKYEAAFRENDIDETVLPSLTHENLKELGVSSLGHRVKLLDAIAAMRSDASGKTQSVDAATTSSTLTPRPEDRAERRQVTVMFSDLVGSTALSACMDPEDLREIISAYQKCVAETVQRFGGFVAKYMGDGVLVYFGYPQAHEDDAERAVRAGLELVTAVGALKTHAPLQTRVGLATGLVVVGDLVGSGASQEQAIVGETPNLAARLQGVAEANAVVIAESTRKLVGELFEIEGLGAQDLKGISGPARAWVALRPASVESRFEALHGSGLTELVGREEELELLLRRWSKAKTGEGQVVLLSGEPGIGKSRLTATLSERVAAEPHTRLRYFCSPQHTDSALYPIISHLERAAGFAHNDTAPAKLDKLDLLLAQSFTTQQGGALLSDMLSVPSDGRYPKLELAPQEKRQRTLEALTAQLEALSRENPVLMVFEDVHWIDPTTLELLGRTIDRVRKLEVLLIITCRPEFDPPWIGRPHVTALNLNRLGERETAAMVERITGDKSLPERIRQEIIERTDGIPLFVEEITKAVLEARSEGTAESAVATIPSTFIGVPASLHASLMARLDRLGPAKEVAQIGAAIGRDFSHALLQAMVRKPETELRSALNRLVAAGLLFQQGVPPHATYLFKHALVQDAAYGTLLREPRRALHARIVETLQIDFPDIAETKPELLARHATEAGQIEKAALLLGRAGQRSLDRSAFVEAAAQITQALELIATLPTTPALRREQIKLQVSLITPVMLVKGYSAPETKAAAQKARQLIEQAETLGETPKDQILLLSTLYGLWVANLSAFSCSVAQEIATQFLDLAEKQNATAPLMIGHRLVGHSLLSTGKPIEGRAHFDHALALYEPAEHGQLAASFGQDVAVTALAWRSMASWMLGYPAAALADAEQTVSKARDIGQAATSMYALSSASFAFVFCGKYSRAKALLDELCPLAADKGTPWWEALGMMEQGWLLALTGQASDAAPLLASGIALFRSIGATYWLPTFRSYLANAYAELSQFDDAWCCLSEAMTAIQRTGETWFEADVYRIAGEVALQGPQTGAAKAEAYFEHALAVARQQQAKSWELRASMSLAHLWRDQGKVQQARELLAPVYGWFTEGFDTRDLKEAKALLEELA